MRRRSETTEGLCSCYIDKEIEKPHLAFIFIFSTSFWTYCFIFRALKLYLYSFPVRGYSFEDSLLTAIQWGARATRWRSPILTESHVAANWHWQSLWGYLCIYNFRTPTHFRFNAHIATFLRSLCLLGWCIRFY